MSSAASDPGIGKEQAFSEWKDFLSL
jgi:hypothetical protein